MRGEFGAVRGELSALGSEMTGEFAAVRGEMAEMRGEIHLARATQLRVVLGAQFASVIATVSLVPGLG